MEIKAFWPDKSLLHKDKVDDILITNIRRGLPRFIKNDYFDMQINPKLSDDDRLFLQRYYKKVNQIRDIEYKDSIEAYVYCNLPLALPKNTMEFLVKKIKTKDNDFLLSFYKQNTNSFELIGDYITENDELKLLSLLNERSMKVNDYDKTRLSRLLEPFQNLDFPKACYCNMYNNTKHYYFYQKDHEHVPGVMLIEVARQAFYAYVYMYGGVKKGEVSISWGKGDMVFPNYAQSNFPVRVMMEDISEGPDIYAVTGVKRLGIRITMYQNFNIVALFNLFGPVIRMDVFNSIRTAGIESDRLRFVSLKYISNHIILVDDNNKKLECKLVNIATKGFGVNSEKPIDEPVDASFKFFLHVDCIGDIFGICKIKWQKQMENGFSIGFEIDSIASDDEYKLKETIKKYSFLFEDREAI